MKPQVGSVRFIIQRRNHSHLSFQERQMGFCVNVVSVLLTFACVQTLAAKLRKFCICLHNLFSHNTVLLINYSINCIILCFAVKNVVIKNYVSKSALKTLFSNFQKDCFQKSTLKRIFTIYFLCEVCQIRGGIGISENLRDIEKTRFGVYFFVIF